MANDRNRSDEQGSGPGEGRQSDYSKDEQVRRGGVGDEVRDVADEASEEFEDTDDLEEEEEDSDGSF